MVGSVVQWTDGDISVVRLNTDGSVDSTFGADGVTTSGPIPGVGQGWNVALDPSGGIIGLAPEPFALCRFLEDDPALLIAPQPISSTGNVDLAVGETHGLNGPIRGVEFWVDVDGDAALDDAIDEFLDAGTYNGSLDLWEAGGPNPAPVGTVTFFAVTHYSGGETVVAEQADVVP